MRTMLSIDDDLLLAAKSLAAQQNKSVDEVISDLLRQALQADQGQIVMRNGIRLLPVCSDSVPVTPEMVQRLLNEPSA